MFLSYYEGFYFTFMTHLTKSFLFLKDAVY